ncbi:transglycosylase SLT domain-containing protein [Roseateles sp. DAIF2]|uniref:transglycosylase SLT domain-containing protein n=1 Tax=Roseateles sp. DAIF2 TaxID=2714952 RepID=UPI0018A2B779|nr:transglycosylase SLT domain-containing protein [Roseateles sp. DAIF2]QPF74223.1 transglycosylase SLT domain-containing protein [Roseateles sp. DAIF2]
MQRLAGWVVAVMVTMLVVLLTIDAAHAADPVAAPAAAAPYRAMLVRAAHSQWGLDAPIATLAAQVHQESGWRPTAVSRVGARGLGQFMPSTASWWCELNGLSPDDCQPENPTWALRALVGYDRWLYERTPQRYAGRDRMWVTLRAYNGGLGHWQAEARTAPGGLQQASRQAVDAACGRARRHVSHCTENLGYPHRILVELQPRYASWGALP